MNHIPKPPGISILRLILTVVIIIFVAAGFIKNKAAVVNKITDITVTFQSPDTTGYKNIEHQYDNGVKYSFLQLKNLTAKQIIEAISKYRHIPVEYRGKKLSKQDSCFAGTIFLDGDVKDILTLLNRLGIYVKYDGKKIIAGE